MPTLTLTDDITGEPCEYALDAPLIPGLAAAVFGLETLKRDAALPNPEAEAAHSWRLIRFVTADGVTSFEIEETVPPAHQWPLGRAISIWRGRVSP